MVMIEDGHPADKPDTVIRCILIGRTINGESETVFYLDENGVHPYLDGYLIVPLELVPKRAMHLIAPEEPQYWSWWDRISRWLSL